MRSHTETLWKLTNGLFTAEEARQIQWLIETEPLDLNLLIAVDEAFGGPSVSHMNCGREGRYEVSDRDIFRPLQYCGMYFKAFVSKVKLDDPLWLTRDVVEMSSLHIEGLIKNIGSIARLPLGTALHKAIVRQRVEPDTWQQIDTFTHIYNDAKHNFSHEKDTHMFSIEDALLSYFVCRKLGLKLYPLAKLSTDIRIFDTECENVEKAQMPAWIVNLPEGEIDRAIESTDGKPTK
jgi:hypothetical protein